MKMLLRTLSRNKLFSTINVIGLSIGLAVALLIFMLVYTELSYDRSFGDYRDIYRVNSVYEDHRLGQTSATTPAGLGMIVRESVPEVESTLRVWMRGHVISTEDGAYKKDWRMIFAEENFFSFFDVPLLYGSFEDVLSRPGTAAVSETQALALFGEGDPVGKTFLWGQQPIEVRAVFRDFPENSTLYDHTIVTRISEFYNDPRARLAPVETFFRLADSADPAQVSGKLAEIAAADFEDQAYTFELQPLSRVHLHSFDISGSYIDMFRSDPGQVRMFSILAVVILLIVCINYMNMSTAQSQKRLREIGLNKILGAQRGTIVWRSYLESVLITLAAFVIALGLFLLLLPDFSNLMGVRLSYAMAGDLRFLVGLAVIFIFIVLFSASYSAFFLSGFPPVMAVMRSGASNKVLRQVLSVLQFAVAIILIAWVIVIKSQTNYIYSKDLGFTPDELVAFWVRTARSSADYDALENDLRRLSSVRETSLVTNFPWAEETSLFKTNYGDDAVQMRYYGADENFIDLLQLELIAGRKLPEPFVYQKNGLADTMLSVVLNRKATTVLEMTPEEAVGQLIYVGDNGHRQAVTVSGVVEDFNFQSLYHPVVPQAIINLPGGRWYQIVSMADNNRVGNVAAYKQVFENLFPNDMFDPHYIKDEIDDDYKDEQRTERLLVLFTLLAIFMACMGVFALTAYLVEQRTREIGIRRVLGSSRGGVLALFARTYLRLLAIAVLIAVPAAILVCNNYLSNFAFHVSLSWWMLAAAAGITLLLVIAAVVAPTFRAANADPAKNLRYE